ncbi:alkaline phosphatase [Nocardia mangyaensis]|uniref:Alkaline phosphatase n=1 Tax=Nocardia mangyaensis TaxID=2213200 RepID=A0A1J0VYP3_9NOCA|nr:BREX-2 system phosphatase PglZ [Nocardia mangyaensis]APE37125.1 alkaline phosphatase [Nocardia mangyaensis]MBC7299325.1 BREX-2 system phosphatase PglZ [Nocardia sp.]
MSREPVRPAVIRRKVESWLGEKEDTRRVIALRAIPQWPGDPVLRIGETTARVVPCPTPLAVRAALHDRSGDERLVLLTELSDSELGDGLLAHLSRAQVRSVDRWDLVRQMFETNNLDPSIVDSRYGGGSWIADALAQYAPESGWPAPPGVIVTRDHVLRCLTAQLSGLAPDQLDAGGLLDWSSDAAKVLRFSKLPGDLLEGIASYLTDIAGPAAVPIMAAVRAGYGSDAIPLGLLAAAAWPTSTASIGPAAGRAAAVADVGTVVAVTRARLEPFFGGNRLTDAQANALRATAEAWVVRASDTDPHAVARMFHRAEKLAVDIDAVATLGASDLLPTGFAMRMRDFGIAVQAALSSKTVTVDKVAAAQTKLDVVEGHRTATEDHHRVETARMAVRLLRWLALPESAAPRTLLEALQRQILVDGWVDRARLDVFAGDVDIAEAYKELYRRVDARRARHDEQFAVLLAADTAAEAQPGAMLRVEDVLDRVVAPILRRKPVLLIVLDGMSVAAATELAESVTRTGTWLELTPGGGPRAGVLAALPTITEVSRCSLLSGRIAVGQADAERAAFAGRYPDGMLVHKGGQRSGAGSVLDAAVTDAVADDRVRLVAAVVNTIDDALDRSTPGITVWSTDTVAAVRDLMTYARNRVVVMISDHGHVIDRGPDAKVVASPSSENRWRPAQPPAGDGEVAVHGSRVGKGGGAVVLPWREELRYGPRKEGYHGGAAPAEAVIPLLVFTAGDDKDVPGWAGAPVAGPDWWREALPDTPLVLETKTGKRSTPEPSLFDDVDASPAEAAQQVARPAMIEALLVSDVYAQRKKGNPRGLLPDDRVAALLAALLAGGGRATMDTMAAHAGVPAHRITGTVTALRKLLQVEGYPVLDIDADGQTVKLDTALLCEQFQLGQP